MIERDSPRTQSLQKLIVVVVVRVVCQSRRRGGKLLSSPENNLALYTRFLQGALGRCTDCILLVFDAAGSTTAGPLPARDCELYPARCAIFARTPWSRRSSKHSLSCADVKVNLGRRRRLPSQSAKSAGNVMARQIPRSRTWHVLDVCTVCRGSYKGLRLEANNMQGLHRNQNYRRVGKGAYRIIVYKPSPRSLVSHS